jgi:hypothetical protein
VKEKKLEQQAQYWERHILRHWAKMHVHTPPTGYVRGLQLCCLIDDSLPQA